MHPATSRPRPLPFTLVWMLSLSAAAVHAQDKVPEPEPAPAWAKDTQGCEHRLRRAMQADESLTWTGSCANGKAEGEGRRELLGKDGAVLDSYVGAMKAGLREGSGRNVERDGASFEGDFLADERSGPGLVVSAKGVRCGGVFADGLLMGEGRCTWPNGDSYSGGFFADYPWGKGVYTFADTSRYEGEFARGLPSGPGMAKDVDGPSFEGIFIKGLPVGAGSFRDAQGEKVPVSDSLLRTLIWKFAPAEIVERVPGDLRYEVSVSDAKRLCSRMPKPDLPATMLSGTAELRVEFIVREGRVTDLRIWPMSRFPNDRARELFERSISLAVRDYECPGRHAFTQTFVFNIIR